MPATSQSYWRPADLHALPDDGLRHECIDGAHLLTPAPRAAHQRAVGALFRTLGHYLDDQSVGEYWIVDLEARLVKRWRHGADRPEIASDILEWQPEGAERAFVLELPAFFGAVLGD